MKPSYSETLDFLFTQLPMFQKEGAGAYKPGLGTTHALAEAFGNPHTTFPTIHVGGTNGKGSTAHTIAAILQSAGYRTGLFTSPHLIDFRERIRVNGQMISEEEVIDFTGRYRKMDFGDIKPSFFELTTIMAFEHFAREKVDVAVIEVGLGGRLDSTNIITPLLSIITNISLDHTALLGDTEALIAGEKAGIIKECVPVVIGRAEGEVREVFKTRADSMKAPITFACDTPGYTSATECDAGIEYKDTPWGTITGELSGNCQPENAATVLAAMSILRHHFPAIDAAAVRDGFANVCRLTGLMGRWMRIPCAKPGVDVFCDTGHNPGGWEYLGKKLSEISARSRLTMIIGFVNDKDLDHIIDFMPRNARYRFVAPSVNRGRAAESTCEIFRSYGIEGQTAGSGSVSETYRQVIDEALPGETVFVGGSTFVVADLLEYLSERR